MNDQCRSQGSSPGPRPPWLRVRMRLSEEFHEVQDILERWHLHTVCREAACPHIGQCFNERTATFLILGDCCTRNCTFCAVRKGSPQPVAPDEPERIAQAVKEMALRHVVVTSVTRDDLSDGGASAFAKTIEALRRSSPHVTIEVLIPDLQGSRNALRTIVEAGPHVLGHNVETVRRLYPIARPRADYERSLMLLATAKEWSSGVTKSGLMVGLGETTEELYQALEDLSATACDIVTVGQYLAPTRRNLPIDRYYTPQEFIECAQHGLQKGIRWVEAGPLVRSSLHAQKQWKSLMHAAFGS